MVHVKKKNNKDVLKVNFFGVLRWFMHTVLIFSILFFLYLYFCKGLDMETILTKINIGMIFLGFPILIYVVYFKAVFGNIVYTKEGVGQSLFGKYIHFIKWEEIKQAGIVTGIRMPCIYFSKEVLPRSKLWNLGFSKINDQLIVCTINKKIIKYVSQYFDTDLFVNR